MTIWRPIARRMPVGWVEGHVTTLSSSPLDEPFPGVTPGQSVGWRLLDVDAIVFDCGPQSSGVLRAALPDNVSSWSRPIARPFAFDPDRTAGPFAVRLRIHRPHADRRWGGHAWRPLVPAVGAERHRLR